MKKLQIAVMGAEHRHIFGQLKGMLDIGCECKGLWTEGENNISQDFYKKFPNIPRVLDKTILFNDPGILNLPSIIRFPLAKLIAKRRAPIAKEIYKELGGSSPILKLTNKKQDKFIMYNYLYH